MATDFLARAKCILIGLCDNGLVANLHKDEWLRFIEKERLSKLTPGLRDRILSCFKVLQDRHRFVRHPRSLMTDPASDLEWLRLALESHRRTAFHGIVLTERLWDCGIICLRKFTRRVTLTQLRAAPKLEDSWFLKADLCQSASPIEVPHWKVLMKLIERNG